jgi:hypothetical protein
MDINIFPWLKDYLPIDVEKCRKYWDKKMNGFQMSSNESEDWKICEKNLHIINDQTLPLTLRTYKLNVKIPFIIANFIIEGEAKKE